MPEKDKNPGDRPTKLTEEFLATMRYVINDGDNALIYTDEDLTLAIDCCQIRDAGIYCWENEPRITAAVGKATTAFINERRHR